MSEKSFAEILQALSKPFPASVVQWRAGATNRDKTAAMALAYVDVRHYMERLDEVAPGWHSEVQPLGNGQVVVRLTVAGVTRTDVGEADPEDANTLTSAFAQAFKRACVQFGLGRDLYHIPKVWCDYDAQGRKLLNTPTLTLKDGRYIVTPPSERDGLLERVAADRGLPQAQPAARRSVGNGDAASVVIKFGKYKGQTLGQILAQDKGYLEWLAEKSSNQFIAGKARQLLETQPAPATEAVEAKPHDLPVAAAPEPETVSGNGHNAEDPFGGFDDDIPF